MHNLALVMDARVKPIPAFYCCYLLRSTVRHASLYVGSSPNPIRRLNQHNGKAKGGAVRTSRLSLRPWEMACVVAGFPSNIAALQFEWAWQNSHLTRHIAQDERISFPVTKIKTNARTGRTRRKPTRPPTSLIEKLSNLHLLLRTKYFSQWPLELRFFSGDVYKAWQSWSQRVDKQVRPEIQIVLDLPQDSPQSVETAKDEASAQPPKKRRKVDTIGKGGVEGVDTTYARYQGLFEKSRFILDEEDGQTCAVCSKEVDIKNELYTLCTVGSCTSLSHVTCLSSHFVQQKGSVSIIPEQGKCPGCKSEIEWHDLMRAVSLRIRGEKEVAKLLKKRRGTKVAIAAEIMEEDESDEDDAEDEGLTSVDVVDEQNEADGDNDDVIDDDMSVASIDSLDSKLTDAKSPTKRAVIDTKLEIVIQDSEDE